MCVGLLFLLVWVDYCGEVCLLFCVIFVLVVVIILLLVLFGFKYGLVSIFIEWLECVFLVCEIILVGGVCYCVEDIVVLVVCVDVVFVVLCIW